MKALSVIFFILTSFQFVNAAQNARIVTDGAMVYKKGNFDSAVIGYLRAGKKVRISSKTFGPFYRVQFKQGVIGYISDIDVQPLGKNSKSMPTSRRSMQRSVGRARSFISKTYLGISYGMLNYSEVFNQRNESESLNFFGIKFSMPMKYLSGPFVLDTNLLYQGDYPSYYNRQIPPSRGISGKIYLYDLQVLYSLAETARRTIWIYMGGGIAVNYSSFVVEINGSKQTLSDVLFGGVITGGMAYQTGPIALKIEPKYYAMKSNYLAIIGSVQYEF